MGKTITKVSKGEVIDYVGDLIVAGDIDASATVIIKDGDLIVHGDIKEGATIKVSLSEELKPSATLNSVFSGGINIISGGNISISSGSSGRSRSSMTSMTIGNKKLMIGSVCIDNRIFSNDQVQEISNDHFIITPASSSPFGGLVSGRVKTIINGVVQEPMKSAPGFATAKIDGKTYQGKEIVVTGKDVLVDGKVPSTSTSSSSTSSTSARRETPKVIIHGNIGDSVVMNSDTEITVKGSIGMSCEISSTDANIIATEIGEKCHVTANTISATIINKGVRITCKQGGLTADQLKDKVTVKSSKQIEIAGNIGNDCVLTSDYEGLSAQNLGNNVSVKVSNAIDVEDIGSNAHITSTYQGLSAHDVGDQARIDVSNSVSINSIGKNSEIKSTYQTVTVNDKVGYNTKITASNVIQAGELLGKNHLTSTYETIDIDNNVADDCTLQASNSVHAQDIGNHCQLVSTYQGVRVNNVGDYVTIKASNDIVISGYCPSNATLNSSYGKVRKANKPKPPAKLVVAEPVDSDMQKAVALSQAEMLKKQGVFASSATSSTSRTTADRPTYESYLLAGKFDSDLQHAISLSQAYQLNKQSAVAPAANSSSSSNPPAPAKPSANEIPEAYLCIITQEIMSDPVLCILDQRTYERAAITEWLEKHKTAPNNREPLPEGTPVAKVLFPNRNLQEIIEEYKQKHQSSVGPK